MEVLHLTPSGPAQGYFCLERVEAGQFTVPPYILKALPTGTYASTQLANVNYAPLAADGIDIASASGSIVCTMNTTFEANTR